MLHVLLPLTKQLGCLGGHVHTLAHTTILAQIWYIIRLPIKGPGAVRLYKIPWGRRLIRDMVIDGASVCGGL